MRLTTEHFEVEVEEVADRWLFVKVRRTNLDLDVVFLQYANDDDTVEILDSAAAIEMVLT